MAEVCGFTLYSSMTPFCMRLGGGSQETVALELLLSFTTVTARGGALGTVRGGGRHLRYINNILIVSTMN